MKLYHFNPNNWGSEYFVMSDSKENAFKAFIDFLKKEMKKEEENNYIFRVNFNNSKEKYEYWINFNHNKLPDGFTIDEYEVNQVIESEIS